MKRTTVRLENAFWVAVDLAAERAGVPWEIWAADALADLPPGTGRASWLRVSSLLAINPEIRR